MHIVIVSSHLHVVVGLVYFIVIVLTEHVIKCIREEGEEYQYGDADADPEADLLGVDLVLGEALGLVLTVKILRLTVQGQVPVIPVDRCLLRLQLIRFLGCVKNINS